MDTQDVTDNPFEVTAQQPDSSVLGLPIEPNDQSSEQVLPDNSFSPAPDIQQLTVEAKTAMPAKITTYWPGQGDPKEEGGMDTTLGHFDPNNPMAKIVPIESYLQGKSSFITAAGAPEELGTWKKLAIPKIGVVNAFINDTGSAVGPGHYDIPSFSSKTADSSQYDTSHGAVMAMTGDEIRQQISQQPASSMIAGDVTQAAIQQAMKSGPVAKNSDGSLDFGGGVSVFPNGIIQVQAGNTMYQYRPGEEDHPHITNIKPSDTWQIISDTNTGNHYRVNKQTGESQQIQLPTEKSNIPDGVTGEEALKYIPESDRGIVKKIANYEMAPPTGFALKSPAWKRVLEGVTAYNPNYDATNYAPKLALKQSFKAGKYSQTVNSLNQAIQHLSELDDASKALNNANWQPYNSIANYLITRAGDPRVTNFEKAANAVQGELATVFKGTGATDQEINHWRETLNSAQSPQQLQQGINEALRLMSGRLDSLHATYTEGLGMPSDIRFIRGNSPKILANKFGQSGQSLIDQDAGSAENYTEPAPQPVTVNRGGQSFTLTPGQVVQDPNTGIRKTYKGGDPNDPNSYQ